MTVLVQVLCEQNKIYLVENDKTYAASARAAQSKWVEASQQWVLGELLGKRFAGLDETDVKSRGDVSSLMTSCEQSIQKLEGEMTRHIQDILINDNMYAGVDSVKSRKSRKSVYEVMRVIIEKDPAVISAYTWLIWAGNICKGSAS